MHSPLKSETDTASVAVAREDMMKGAVVLRRGGVRCKSPTVLYSNGIARSVGVAWLSFVATLREAASENTLSRAETS